MNAAQKNKRNNKSITEKNKFNQHVSIAKTTSGHPKIKNNKRTFKLIRASETNKIKKTNQLKILNQNLHKSQKIPVNIIRDEFR